jgi:aryl-alcohol dehydrogenase-like predicted oxidoreductase
MTPIEERTCVRSLDDLIKAGKILYIGISDVPAWVVSRVDAIAELRGWTPFIGTQIM